MDNHKDILEELKDKGGSIKTKKVLVGLDGFVDVIVTAVDKRSGQGDQFTAIPKLADFGNRIVAAAGKSTNIELFPRMEKLGGNGPIMANAMLSIGSDVKYVGPLGDPGVHPVFKEFAEKTEAVNLGEPGVTHALEFNDGKLMLGKMASLDDITYGKIIDSVGEGAFFDLMSRMDLVSMVNWTMIPNMTDIFNAFLEKVLPNLGPRDQRMFFFDLADPEKRSETDLKSVLDVISKFQSYGNTIIGLNLKEAQQVDRVLGFDEAPSDEAGLKKTALRIREYLGIHCVVVHPVESAACATKEGAFFIKGSLCEKPLITTGAGDHFNGGFCSAQLMGLSPEASLALAVSTSGSYVRTAKSPTLSDLEAFINSEL